MLAELLNCDRLTAIVDVGASPIDSPPPYKAMLDQRLCTVVGFEPNAEALAVLQAHQSGLETYYPTAIGHHGMAVLHKFAKPGFNSLLEVDKDAMGAFAAFKGWSELAGTENVPLKRLYDLVGEMDLLKIDVQGTEMDIFRSASTLMDDVVAVHTEVSFVTLYKNQPPFGEVDLELRRHGLVPHHFAEIKKWWIAPMTGPIPHPKANQLLEADIVYVRDFTKMDDMDDNQLKHLAMIAHYCYGSVDLVIRCLTWLAKRNVVKSDSAQRYLDGTKVP